MIFRIEHRNFLQRYLRLLDPFGRQGYFIRRPVPDGFIHAKVMAPRGVVIFEADQCLGLASPKGRLR